MKVFIAIVAIALISLALQIIKAILKPSVRKESMPALKHGERIVYTCEMNSKKNAIVLVHSGSNVRIRIIDISNFGKELAVPRDRCILKEK